MTDLLHRIPQSWRKWIADLVAAACAGLIAINVVPFGLGILGILNWEPDTLKAELFLSVLLYPTFEVIRRRIPAIQRWIYPALDVPPPAE